MTRLFKAAKSDSMWRIILQLSLIAVFSFVIGMFIGVGHAHAEILANVYTGEAGYSGNAGAVATTPPSGMSLAGYGLTTSSWTYNMYRLRSIARIWHQEISPPNLLQAEITRDCFNCKNATTTSIASSGYGDGLVNQSLFLTYSFSSPVTYHTSVPDYSDSCWAFWNNGTHC
jgi:hypothetical protein